MARHFSGFETAAFWLTKDGDLALGGNLQCSIDHSTLANAFGLGDEGSRGFIIFSGSENVGVMEFWLKEARIQDDMTFAIPQADEDRIYTAIGFALLDSTIGRLVDQWKISVRELDGGEQVLEREIDPSDYPALEALGGPR